MDVSTLKFKDTISKVKKQATVRRIYVKHT